MHCRTCQYDLSASRSRRCPECGSAFDPGDVATFQRSVDPPACRQSLIFSVAIWVCCVPVTAFAFITALGSPELNMGQALLFAFVAGSVSGLCGGYLLGASVCVYLEIRRRVIGWMRRRSLS